MCRESTNIDWNIIAGFITVMVVAGLGLGIIWYSTSIPLVQVSSLTGKCVRVVYQDHVDEGCKEPIPEKHLMNWVR